MDRLLEIKTKLVTFAQNNPVAVIIASLVFLLFIPIIILLNISSSQNTPIETPGASPTSTETIPTEFPQPTGVPEIPGSIYEEKTAKDTGTIPFVESADGVNESQKETLPDGSIKYTMDSTNPNRSDVSIVKNGSIIFMRYTVTGGPEVSDGYKNLHGKQSHTLPGPTFYGSNTVIYFYQDGGTALTVDPKTGITYEEFTFQPPISVEEFNQKYRQYIN